MKNVTINLSNKAAERYSNLTKAEKETLSALFDEILRDKRTLFQVMDDMSEYAKKQGLTPEKLDELLNDDSE
ncbi:MAG: hypothetical protein ACLFM7_06215 [Bacteroidales bacterium]